MKTSNRITKTVLLGAATLVGVAMVPLVEGAMPTMNIETVFIGDAGNANDTVASPQGTYHGAVSYEYYIGKYEVTQEQWTEFLNAVATVDDPHGLYNSDMNSNGFSGITQGGVSGSFTYSVDPNYAKRPVVFVSVVDAKRFCNWLTTGDTESGRYNVTTGGANDVRNTVEWFSNGGVVLPDENEWYKAAYYDPAKQGGAGYYTYSTTGSEKTEGDVMNSSYANYDYSYRAAVPTYFLNPVDFYENYKSAYEAVDMTGNVWEWTDSKRNASNRVLRGATFLSYDTDLAAGLSRVANLPDAETVGIGFRVASLAPIPEPAEIGVIGGALVGLLCLLRRKRRAVAP